MNTQTVNGLIRLMKMGEQQIVHGVSIKLMKSIKDFIIMV